MRGRIDLRVGPGDAQDAFGGFPSAFALQVIGAGAMNDHWVSMSFALAVERILTSVRLVARSWTFRRRSPGDQRVIDRAPSAASGVDREGRGLSAAGGQ